MRSSQNSKAKRIRFASGGPRTLGLYIHIPFCKSKCSYCDFYSLAGREPLIVKYFDALKTHIADSAKTCSPYTVDTVYFGGGTPTHAGAAALTGTLKEIRRSFRITRDAEITFEANPASAAKKDLKKLRGAGFNRISIGIQSAIDSELAAVLRPHTFDDAVFTVRCAKEAGFTNISADVMFGLPGQTMQSFNETIRRVLELDLQHISCYGLRAEEDTPIYTSRDSLADDDVQADMYLYACEELEKNGLMQYEISNFAKDGYVCRHNLKYWNCGEYLGFGPGAHSFMSGRRFSFVRDLDTYIGGVYDPDTEIVDENEDIQPGERVGEYLMLRMRLCDGIQPEGFERRFQRSFRPFAQRLEKYVRSGHTEYRDGVWRLTRTGFFISNRIIGELLDAATVTRV